MRRWTTALPRSREAATPAAQPWVEALALGVPLLVLTALSLYQLGALSLWRDEVASVVFANAPLGDLLTVVGRDRETADLANMATYYLILHFWLAIGESETWIRLPSVVFGVAAVVPTYLIARRLGGWITGALAAAIFVLIPYVIHYNQEARGYSLAMLVSGVLTWLVLVGVERRERVWPWLAYGLVASLGIYVHFFVALVVLTHGAWVLITRRIPRWPAALSASAPIALAVAPIPFVVLEHGGEQEWIPPLSGAVAATNLTALAGGALPLLAAAVLVGGALVVRNADARVWLIAGCVLAPVFGAAAISLVKPMFVARYLIVVLPSLAVIVACGVLAVPRRAPQAGVATALLVLLALAVPQAYADRHQQDWRALGEWMASRTEPGDRMIAGNARRSVQYYLGRAGAETIPAPTRTRVVLEEGAVHRVWVTLTGTVGANDVTERLSGAFAVAEDRLFGARLRIVLLTPADDAAAVGAGSWGGDRRG